MSFESIEARYLFTTEVNSSFINDFLHECLALGCRTQRTGETRKIHYRCELTEWNTKEETLDVAIEQLEVTKSGSVDLWFNDVDFTLQINLLDNIVADNAYSSLIGLSVESVYFKQTSTLYSREEAQQNVRDFIELATTLYEFSTPAHVFGNESSIALDEPAFETTIDDLGQGHVEEVYWLNIFSPTTVEHLGRDRVLSAPAWKVEELDEGGILIVLTDNPLEVGDVYTVGNAVEDHLGLR